MTIYIANLSVDTLEDDLNNLFSRFGKLKSVKLMKEPYSGISKCFGFIDMEDDASANTAIKKLDNTEFMGKTIVVSKARQRQTDKRQDNNNGSSNNRRKQNYFDSNKNYNY